MGAIGSVGHARREFCPGGTPGNSRFNAGEARTETLVPKGRLKTLVALSRPFGTDLLFGSLTRRFNRFLGGTVN
jgi:hypothetical protein